MEDSEILSPQTLQLLAAAAMEQEAADETAAKEAPREAQQGPEADARARERKGGGGRLRGGASGNNLGKVRPPKDPRTSPGAEGAGGKAGTAANERLGLRELPSPLGSCFTGAAA